MPKTHTPVVGHPDYSISKQGKVFSMVHNWRGYGIRELIPFPNKDGYLAVKLMVEGKGKRFLVHKLMAITFLPPRPSGSHQIRHLDGNKENNAATNLKWGTAKENAQDREKHGKTSKGEHRHSAKLTAKQVLEIRDLRLEGVPHNQIAEKYKVRPETISMICRHKTWKHI